MSTLDTVVAAGAFASAASAEYRPMFVELEVGVALCGVVSGRVCGSQGVDAVFPRETWV